MSKKRNKKETPKIGDRIKGDTPKFFKKLQVIGVAIAAIGSAVIAAPVILPAVVVTVAGYMVVTGGVISAVSQLTIKHEEQ